MKRRPWPALAWLGYVALLFAGLDLVILAAGLDKRLLAPLLYYQHDQLDLHAPSQDPVRIFELRPGAKTQGGQTYTVNSLGFRDQERSPAKPKGVRRIVVLGGSTTFGVGVDDPETFPARLQRLLDKSHPDRFEVWNAGLPAYVLSQEVSLAKEIVERYAPDLLVFQYMNRGRRAFLISQDPWPYLDRDPGLWLENLRFLPSGSLARWLCRHWAFLRSAVIGLNRLPSVPSNNPFYDDERANVAAFERFNRTVGQRIPMVFLALDTEAPADLSTAGAPIISLYAEENLPGLPLAELFPPHPPSCAFDWYAEVLAARLPDLAPSLFDGRSRKPSGFRQPCTRTLKDGDDGVRRAAQLLARLASANPGKPKLWLGLADAALRSGDVSLAKASLARASSRRKELGPLARELDAVAARLKLAGPGLDSEGTGALQQGLAAALLDKARKAAADRDTGRSLELASQAEALQPLDETRKGLLLLYAELGKYAKVLELSEKLGPETWRDPAVALSCAAAAKGLGRKEAALRYIETSRKLPFSEDASLWIAGLERGLGEPASALRTLAELGRQRPSSLPAKVMSAELQASQGDCDKAGENLRSATASLSRTDHALHGDELRHRAALTYQACKDRQAAVAAFEDLVRRNPDTAVYRKDLGVARFYLGQVKEAKADLEEAIKLDPGLDSAYASLAAVLLAEGLKAESAAVCRRRPKACH
ncbi:MAG: tetratricopeptide repeat protein [Elusimicrobia bacterium]|nr:tetratricopeptide repeat protein [Elusimicrobiota bacterium]